jgi:hypothetical protein
MQSKYIVLVKNIFSLNPYTIVPLREEDMQSIKVWRNSQIDVLRQKNQLTDEDQHHYFNHIVALGFSKSQPKEILFSYLENGECIGYGGFVNIDWEKKVAEISFLVATSRSKNLDQYEISFLTFLSLLKEVAFTDIKLNKLFTETYDIRDHHISVLEKSGFLLKNRIHNHQMIHGKMVDSLIHEFTKELYEK